MNDNPKEEDIKRAIKDARVRARRAKMKGDTGDEEFNTRKLKALSERNWEKWWLKKALKKATKNSLAHGKAKNKL